MRESTPGRQHPPCGTNPYLHHDSMLKDDRVRQEEQRTIFDVKEAPHKLG